jgi:hypothetical protein
MSWVSLELVQPTSLGSIEYKSQTQAMHQSGTQVVAIIMMDLVKSKVSAKLAFFQQTYPKLIKH